MNVDDFINQGELLGEKWGTLIKSLFNTAPKKWDISFYKNGLKERVVDLHSESVPFYDIFLKPSLIGKTYLIYKKRDYRDYGSWKAPAIKLIGLIQSSEIGFRLSYPYMVATDANDMILGKNSVHWSIANPKRREYETEIDYLNKIFKGKIWKGSYALDLSYLIGNSKSVFMNWDSNPLEGEK